MNEPLRLQLLEMARHDLAVRERLAADGSLFEGYHPDMQAVHDANAETLAVIVVEWGWPSSRLVGEDGAEAAWLIAQHAIRWPEFQRECLAALQSAAAEGQVPAWQPAYLLDRIKVFEGLPQVYGTSFDWDEDGEMSPRPIAEPDRVDELRASVGLPPMAEAVARHRKNALAEPVPADLRKRREEMDRWARQVGWR